MLDEAISEITFIYLLAQTQNSCKLANLNPMN